MYLSTGRGCGARVIGMRVNSCRTLLAAGRSRGAPPPPPGARCCTRRPAAGSQLAAQPELVGPPGDDRQLADGAAGGVLPEQRRRAARDGLCRGGRCHGDARGGGVAERERDWQRDLRRGQAGSATLVPAGGGGSQRVFQSSSVGWKAASQRQASECVSSRTHLAVEVHRERQRHKGDAAHDHGEPHGGPARLRAAAAGGWRPRTRSAAAAAPGTYSAPLEARCRRVLGIHSLVGPVRRWGTGEDAWHRGEPS